MTTAASSTKAGATARAMTTAYEKASAGQKAGTFACPKCGGTVRFTAAAPEKTDGRCNSANCVRWPL